MSRKILTLLSFVALLLAANVALTRPASANSNPGPHGHLVPSTSGHEGTYFAKSGTISPMSSESACMSSPSHANCDGANPTGCTGVSTVLSATILSKEEISINGDPPSTTTTNVGTIELRWSSGCQSNWTRITAYSNQCVDGKAALVPSNSSYPDQVITAPSGSWCNGTVAYTSMYYAPNEAVAASVQFFSESRSNDGSGNYWITSISQDQCVYNTGFNSANCYNY